MPRFAASKGQANQDQGGGNTKQGLPPSIGVRSSLARLMSRKVFSNPVAVALARIFDDFDFDFDYSAELSSGGIYNIRVNASRIYIIGKFKLKLKGSSETLRTNIAVFNAEGDNELIAWVPLFQNPSPTTITAIDFLSNNRVILGVEYGGQNNTSNLGLIQDFNSRTGVRNTTTGLYKLNLTDDTVSVVHTIKSSNAHLFVGTDNGIFIFNADGTRNITVLPVLESVDLANTILKPSVYAILVDTSNNRVYIGGSFKINQNNQSTPLKRNGVAAIIFPLTDGQGGAGILDNWNPPVLKSGSANVIYDIQEIQSRNSSNNLIQQIEIYGSFTDSTTNKVLLAMTVSTGAGTGGGTFVSLIEGQGVILKVLNADGVKHLCGFFRLSQSDPYIGVRSIFTGSTVDYLLPSDSEGSVYNIAKTSDGKIFVGGIGIKPQKLSRVGGTLS